MPEDSGGEDERQTRTMAQEWPPPLPAPTGPLPRMAGMPWRGFLTGLLANATFYLTSLPSFDPWVSRLPAVARGPLQQATTPGMLFLMAVSLACLVLDIRRCRRAGDGTGAAGAILGASVNTVLWLVIVFNQPGDCACGPA